MSSFAFTFQCAETDKPRRLEFVAGDAHSAFYYLERHQPKDIITLWKDGVQTGQLSWNEDEYWTLNYGAKVPKLSRPGAKVRQMRPDARQMPFALASRITDEEQSARFRSPIG